MFAQLLAVLFLVSCYLTWYFMKKKPDKKNRNRSIIALVALFILIGITAPVEHKKLDTKPKVEMVSKKEKKTKTKKKTEEKKSTETKSSSKEEQKKFNDKANSEFATYLGTKLNEQLLKSGVEESITVIPNSSVIVYIIVPQNYKYKNNPEIQQLADVMLDAKNNIFAEWAINNGYDATEDNPDLYMMSEDKTSLAEESAWSKKMKLKINNN